MHAGSLKAPSKITICENAETIMRKGYMMLFDIQRDKITSYVSIFSPTSTSTSPRQSQRIIKSLIFEFKAKQFENKLGFK
tara:strand:- start:259 stop:498 length:240 start_codon:yes stop_codon:yes gene_type:complete